MPRRKKTIGGDGRHKKHDYSSSSSDSISDSSESDSCTDSGSYTSSSSLSENYASEACSVKSNISVDKEKYSQEFRKLHNTRTTRGKIIISKHSVVVEFVTLTKEILKTWDKGGYITGDFLNKVAQTYKTLLVKKLEMTRSDGTTGCNCCSKTATYIVALAFCMHYNASGEDSEKWKIRFHSLVKNLIGQHLITLSEVSSVFPLDPSGNYFIDKSANDQIIISGVQDCGCGLGTITSDSFISDTTGDAILGPFPTSGFTNLKDLAIVLETERVLKTNMTLVSNRLMTFIDENVHNH